jgi:eukaryotic-like serine/threonine-protein kinase
MATAPHRIQRFEVLGHLGTGGMGTVYRARDPQLEREVAIKVLASPEIPLELDGDRTLDLRTSAPRAPEGLLGEARIMAQLSHPNVLPIYEVGLADGAVFLVMEYIPGSDLATWLGEPRTPEQIRDVFAQAARGITAAHARGIVHRDVKPANILIGSDGRVRVADFGLSRLVARSPSMVRVDTQGTPHYMAPELWRGEDATPKTDVYALCKALADAIDPAQLAEPLRSLVRAGMRDEPAARPELATLVAALEGRRLRPRWYLLAAGAGVLGAAAIAMIALSGRSDDASCAIDPARFPDAAALERALAVDGDAFDGAARDTLKAFAAQRHAIEELAAASCTGELGAAQRTARAACLDRRTLELRATADAVLAAPQQAIAARARSQQLAAVTDCVDMPATPVRERAAADALFRRFVALDPRAGPENADGVTRELADIERRATELGETELAARAALRAGLAHHYADRLALADEAAQRGHRLALELHANDLIASALLLRTRVAALRGDAAAAKSFAGLALELTAQPSALPATRAAALAGAGREAAEHGDYGTAVAKLREGLDVLGRAGVHDPDLETDLRFNLITALASVEGGAPTAIELATQTATRVRGWFGDKDPNYGVALNLVAYAYRGDGKVTAALPYRRAALEMMVATMPPDNSHVVLQRADYAADLYATGDYESAQREMLSVIAETTRNQTLRGSRPGLLGLAALASFHAGQHDAGLAQAEQAVEESLAVHGKDHPTTLENRLSVLQMQLELGRLDAAARSIATLEQGYGDDALDLLRLHGIYAARLATLRGAPRDGEALARAALADADQHKATPEDRAMLHVALGESLLADHRYADARTELEAAEQLKAKLEQSPDVRAALDVALAACDAGLGVRDARARAQQARAVLDKYPGEILARRRADALIGRR